MIHTVTNVQNWLFKTPPPLWFQPSFEEITGNSTSDPVSHQVEIQQFIFSYQINCNYISEVPSLILSGITAD